jgi:hypothetical protein
MDARFTLRARRIRLQKSLMRMFVLRCGGNETLTTRLVDEEDFGGRCVEALEHDTGKCHEI